MSLRKRLLVKADSAIVPSENFKVITYTGNGSTQSITGVGFQPDFVWIKQRDAVRSNNWYDSTRGPNKILFSNSTAAEDSTSTEVLQSFDTDGFTLGNLSAVNASGGDYVAWCWKANGGTTSSNTNGTLTSTVQANTQAGFSIVKYTGVVNGSSKSFGHGLSQAPDMVIIKDISWSTPSWFVWHKDLTGNDYYLRLESTNAEAQASTIFNSAPTSTVVNIGNDSGLGDRTDDYIAFCFHSVDGFSKIGSYTGGGSNATIVQTGFEPAMIILKPIGYAGVDWFIVDNKRDLTNPRDKRLRPNTNGAEDSTTAGKGVNFLSNGFELQGGGAYNDALSGGWLYIAFAADPDTEAPTLASSFNAELYVGTKPNTNNITGIGFDPNFVWIKRRDGSDFHSLLDTVRGQKVLSSDSSSPESDFSGGFDFITDGFQVLNTGQANENGGDFVAWTWKADDNEATIEEVTSDLDAIAVYKFESNANDVTGNHNGTATDVTYVSGKFNNAADFNNTSSKIVIGTQSSVIPSGSTGVSFSFWVYLDSIDTSSNYDHWFIGQENYGGSFEDGEFSVRLYGGKVYTDYAQSSSIYRQRQSSTTLSTGQWYHIVATYDTSNANITEVYLNGSLETTTNLTSGGTFTTNSLMQNSSNISIGGGPAFTDGKIDQFRIYNQVLTASNVTTLYNETASDNNDLNLGMTYVSSDQSIVSANSNAGFSIVKFNGDGSVNTVPHGLSAAPEMILLKRLDSSGDWQVYHTSIGNNNKLSLNSTAASSSTTRFNNTSPTATVFTFNSSSYTGNIIAYCFHSVTGFSKFGSYTGNASSNSITGLGFRPDWVMIKRTDSANGWNVFDSLRGAGMVLFPNSSNAEADNTANFVSFDSDGFSLASSGGDTNASGGTYIYWAVAKNVPSNTTLADSFKVLTYSGNATDNRAFDIGFRPDMIWYKARNQSYDHNLSDAVRGAQKQVRPNRDIVEQSATDLIKSFTSTGFTVGTGGDANASGNDYVAWAWKAGNTWQSNVDGSIPSLTNANTANGFSIVKYDGTQAAGATVGHGLSSAPELIIVKRLDYAEDWVVYNSASGNTKTLNLNNGDAEVTDAAFNNTTPTSSVFTLSNCASGSCINSNSGTYIAYCFHSVSGYSDIGSYTGSGSDGNAVTTGFQPDFLMVKRVDSTGGWLMFESARSGSNPIDDRLEANNNQAEQLNSSSKYVDFNSNDFEANGSDSELNASGATYIYMAFRMNPSPIVAAGEMAFLVLGGGGGGGSTSDNGGAGGGAGGGLRTSFGTVSGRASSVETNITLSSVTYTITVGGAGGYSNNASSTGSSGSSSSIAASGLTTITALGGGGGGSSNNTAGQNGGCGGGGHSSTGNPGTGTAGQGFDASSNSNTEGSGGAGTGATNSNRNGGDGTANEITGTSITYGGGAGGGGALSGSGAGGNGGSGGGGNGQSYTATSANSSGTVGTDGLGGGGGGAGGDSRNGISMPGSSGGNGVVILRMRTSDYSGTTTGSPTVTTVGDETILKYTGSGTYVHS